MILSKKLELHLAAIAAAGAGMAVASESQAAVVSSGPVNINIPATTAGVYLNVVTGVSSTSPASAPGWDVNPWSSTTLGLFSPSAPAGGVYTNIAGNYNLPVGAVVGGGPWGSLSPTALNWNLNSDNNYVGFRFQNETNGNATHFGYMQIRIGATITTRSIIAYAYENVANTNITVPTPGAASLLAVGAAGLLGRRRK